MRKIVGLLVLATLLIGLVAAAGCAKKEGVITTPMGDVEYESSKNEILVTNKGQSTTWSVSEQSEKALGVPVPSHAKLEKGSAAVISTEDGTEKWAGATFWSPESVDTVIAWYKDKLSGMAGFSDTSTKTDGQPIGLFSVRTGDTVKSIVAGAGQGGDPGKTKIVISTAAGSKITGM
jgi:hypothetical protein